ncbi:hypothetical protein NIES2101_13615 [Calothrix sp. HK-06]|nr:hypothetical protein NIES2101_13615 [Calothrix sp. HK-06]
MPNNYGFAAKKVYPSDKGIHIEHYTEEEAKAAYEDALRKNKNVTIDGVVLAWHLPPRKNHFT